VHQLVCFDLGGSSGQQQLRAARTPGSRVGGSEGHQEAESGAAMGASGKQSWGRRQVPGSRVEGSFGNGRREGDGGTAADFSRQTAYFVKSTGF
jgi:hypothetical protein